MKQSSLHWFNPWGFVLFLFVGIGLIFVLKSIDLGQWTVTVILVILMIVYALLAGFRGRELDLQKEQAGDNLYYLGFLYTLSSLAASLITLSDEEIENISTDITYNLGIAVVTTIAGIALRALFVQKQIDVSDNEDAAQQALAESADNFMEILENMESNLGDIRTRLQTQMANFADVSEQITTEYTEQLRTQTKALVGGMQQTGEQIQSRSEQIDQNLGRVSAATITIAGRIEAIEIPADSVIRKLEDALQPQQLQQRIDDLQTAFGGFIEAINSQSSTLNSVFASVVEQMRNNRMDGALNDLGDRINKVDIPKDAIARKLDEVLQPQQLQQRIDDLQTTFSGLVATIERQTSTLDGVFEDLVRRIDEIDIPTDAVEQKLDVALQPLQQPINRLGEAFSGLAGQVESKAATVVETLDAAGKQIGHKKQLEVKPPKDAASAPLLKRLFGRK